MSRILAISDIHGHAEGARSLLSMADYIPGTDRLYLLGDFIDRGRDTWDALGAVRQWTAEGAKALLGNMERWLLELSAEGNGLPEDSADLVFLKETPLYWRDGGDWLFVHAGIRPGVPLEQQRASDLIGIRQEFWGQGAGLGQDQGQGQGQGQSRSQAERLPYTVVFGHTPTFKLGAPAGELWFGPDRIGIDTGAKHGCRLTLVDLTGGLSYSCSTAQPGVYTDYRIASFSGVGI
ncbi:metallophosphoesterase [Cohnella zeiphila]|uniref:Metallophosphoesterase n=1 Tax=Cohnella zeiphila TaxID=2761120 RepID=A0A7X0SP63_9BACL|nr:metallophosphoesterase [Cohnella zeiphila]MBB6731268.1 metallophosphoesterase [Cohnella zeiphila]